MSAPDPARKRQRLTTACEHCRARRIRCDGNKPSCGPCLKRSSQCVYKATADVEHTHAYIDSLVNRVSQLEQELENAHATILKLSTNPANALPPPQYLNIDPNLPPPLGTSSDDAGTVDAMGGGAGIDVKPEIGHTFYGSSSALGFTCQMYGTILPRDTAPERQGASSSSTQLVPDPPTTMATYVAPDNFTLLPRELADRLMYLYWDRVHVLYPFLHKASFSQAYEDLWKPSSDHHQCFRPGLGLGASKESGPSSVIFHCALNAALALAMQFSDLPLAEKERLSSACLAKSKDLLRLDLFDDGNIALVQTLLLLTQYFQSTNWPNKCWTSIGLACRLAQGLGLHVEENHSEQPCGIAESEIRRRVWHGCTTMDIIVSMTLGRPAMLNGTAALNLPAPIDGDEELLVPGSSATKLSSIAFFTETVKLYRIVGRILGSVYTINDDHHDRSGAVAEEESRQILLDLDSQLSQLVSELPKGLDWLSGSGDELHAKSGILARQSHVLHVRLLHARILLFRPAFLHYCRSVSALNRSNTRTSDISQAPVSDTPHAYDMAMACVSTSFDLIAAIKMYSATDATGAWWYNVFYIRTAAMVVLLSGICPSICENTGDRTWSSAWRSCEEVLTNLLPQFKPVRTCLATLTALHQNILRQRSEAGLYDLDYAGNGDHEFQHAAPPPHLSGQDALHWNANSNDIGIPTSTVDNSQYLLDSIFDPYSFVEADLFTDFGLDYTQPIL